MAVDSSVASLLNKLTTSLTSAQDAIPEIAALEVPDNGISLFDVKNELFLSYLQNLVFLILFKLRNNGRDTEDTESEPTEEQIVEKLAELRVYLERGVRPLEGRLKHTLDRLIRATDAAAAREQAVQRKALTNGSTRSGEGEEDSEEDSEEEGLGQRPNLAALAQRQTPGGSKQPSRSSAPTSTQKPGVYRPPRINPTSMPTTTEMNADPDRRGRSERSSRPGRAAAVDEFIAAEMSGAPLAEASIGSTIVGGGRRTKTARERKDEDERRAYEEANFTRLPRESKKDRAAKGRGQRERNAGWGGEELRGIKSDLGRIERLTSKRSGGTFGEDRSGGRKRRKTKR